MRQELHNEDRTASGGHAGRTALGALASRRARLGVVLAAAVAGILTIAPGAFAATTPLVSTSTSAPTSGTVGNGTSLFVNFNEAPVLAGSYSLTLADGHNSGTLSTADGNLSATVSGNQIHFTADGNPVMSVGGSLSLSSPLEIVSSTGVNDGSGNPWNLAASGQADKPEALSSGDHVFVTYNAAPTVDNSSFSLTLAEGSMSATIAQTDSSTSVVGDTVDYDVTGAPAGTVPTDPPTVTNFTGITGATAVADTCSSDGTGTGTDPCVYVNVDVDRECSVVGVTRVFGGSNCSISVASAGDPVAPDVYDVIPVPTDDLPGPNPTNGKASNDDYAPEVITNCESGSTDTVYDVSTGAELGTAPCGTGNPNECAIGNTCSNTLDYISTPNLESYEEVGVVETLPGSTYVSPTAVPPQLSSINVSGDQATFNYYGAVACENVSGDQNDHTVAQFSYTSPYTDENYSDRVWATDVTCPGTPTGSGSSSIVVTYPGPIPYSAGVRFKFAGYGPGQFIMGASGSASEYEIEASESAYVGPAALLMPFTPQSTTPGATAPGGSTPPKPSILSLSLLKVLLTKIHNGAKFKFTATSGATSYLCALVRLPSGKKHHALKLHYAFCSASKTYKSLKSGRYELFVKAVGPGLESKALTKTFTIKDTKTKKHHG